MTTPVAAQTLCFTCGLPWSEPVRLNRLPNGQICPACRDRALETLPGLLPWRPDTFVSEMGGDQAELVGEVEHDAQLRPWPPRNLNR